MFFHIIAWNSNWIDCQVSRNLKMHEGNHTSDLPQACFVVQPGSIKESTPIQTDFDELCSLLHRKTLTIIKWYYSYVIDKNVLSCHGTELQGNCKGPHRLNDIQLMSSRLTRESLRFKPFEVWSLQGMISTKNEIVMSFKIHCDPYKHVYHLL